MRLEINTPYSIRLGVVGAGTMGSGIALTALLAGMVVTLYDVAPEMLERARSYLAQHLSRKGREISLKNLTLTSSLEDMAGAGVVIEAAPEDMALKEGLFSRLDRICPPPAILATNTSTLAVTAIAAATSTPQRVAGMHFFNPAPVLPLVELVSGAETHPDVIRALDSLARLLGKTPVVAGDTPGFIVNRVARPFYGEALRLLGEGVATHVEIDRLVRLGAGFSMGPFQLMDLIGIDVNFAATQSMYAQTFGEPRYRPHPLQARLVQQKTLGRKTGRGFYRYDPEPAAEDPPLPRKEKATGFVLLQRGSWTPGLAEACQDAGYLVSGWSSDRPVIGVLTAGPHEGVEKGVVLLDRELPPDVPLLLSTAATSLVEAAASVSHPERLVGFDGLFFPGAPVVTLAASPAGAPQIHARVERFFAGLGRLPIWVQDSPGLVLPRIIGMLANEAAFAVAEGVADQETIDRAMQFGANYPRGPLAWAKNLGYAKIIAVLDHLYSEFHEERYRAAPLLRRWARLENIST